MKEGEIGNLNKEPVIGPDDFSLDDLEILDHNSPGPETDPPPGLPGPDDGDILG